MVRVYGSVAKWLKSSSMDLRNPEFDPRETAMKFVIHKEGSLLKIASRIG